MGIWVAWAADKERAMALALTLLGTGSPAPLIHRAGSSYLVELAGEKLLFDCGPGEVRRLL